MDSVIQGIKYDVTYTSPLLIEISCKDSKDRLFAKVELKPASKGIAIQDSEKVEMDVITVSPEEYSEYEMVYDPSNSCMDTEIIKVNVGTKQVLEVMKYIMDLLPNAKELSGNRFTGSRLKRHASVNLDAIRNRRNKNK